MTTRRPTKIARAGRLVPVALLVATLGALAGGGVAWWLGSPHVAGLFWSAGILATVLPATWWVVTALRHGRFGADLIAVLALGGALVIGEYLAGALIAVMLATGRTLDAAAERRAGRDLRALTERVPLQARRIDAGAVVTVPVPDLVAGDRLIVGSGEVVPVDGLIVSDTASLDESALTGESMYSERRAGETVRSGTVNAGAAMEITATATAENSTYAGIVRLAQDAAAQSAPVVRLADRFAAWFLPLTLAVAGAAWLLGGSAERAVAVLVVATPCPLLLAAPVAIVSGLSRAARIGVIVRSGGALETLGRATTLVLDKTGTVTAGRPVGSAVSAAPGWTQDEVLRLAAAADRFSPHVLARAIVDAAESRGLTLAMPTDVVEEPGTGTTATVEGKRVRVGNHTLPPDLAPWADAVLTGATFDGSVIAWVSVNDALVGAILLQDPLRVDAFRTLRRLRAAGVNRMVMLTGDRSEPAEHIAAMLGLDELRAGQSPADKVAGVQAERAKAVTAMVGDGVNDAPALAAASVGIALSGFGSTASSEAADIVLATGRIDRLADAILIARRARRIAVQSAGVGMGLSMLAMCFAALGLLAPAIGAVLQEAIDLAVILNALRVLRTPGGNGPALASGTEALLRRFSAEHDHIRGELGVFRAAAHQLCGGDDANALSLVRRADTFVQQVILPHERAEDRGLYPALAAPLGGPEATATMSRMHAEIDCLARRLHSHVVLAGRLGRIGEQQREDLLACLYGMDELLAVHFIAEEENYFTLLSGE